MQELSENAPATYRSNGRSMVESDRRAWAIRGAEFSLKIGSLKINSLTVDATAERIDGFFSETRQACRRRQFNHTVCPEN